LTFSIAVAGKGGSGKTTLSALIIRYFLKKGLSPVLAVDADPNSNLGESLGLKVEDTVGRMIERFQKSKIEIPSGLTKESYLEFQLNSLLIESNGLDLLTMGRGEGQDCYCYPNLILRKFMDHLNENYPIVILDNEAGMEHLSRGTTQNIDELLIVSNYSVKGIRTIARIQELVRELKLRIKHQSVVITSAPVQFDQSLKFELDRLEIKADAVIPFDEQIFQFDLKTLPLIDLPDTSPAVKELAKFIPEILPVQIKSKIK
jgi:CO dehydrogenase maturation factor